MEGMMRVSVVATGIDALDVHSEIPVPRRSMSAPLTQQVAFEEPAPAPAAPIPAPAQAAVAHAAEAPSLFTGIDQVERAAASDMAEDIFAETPLVASDGLPPPAYRPEVAAFEPQPELEAEPEAFCCATPRRPPGTPSP